MRRSRIYCKGYLSIAFAVLALLCPAAAEAYSTAPGYNAADYATGFLAGPSGWGPIGLAFDQSDNLYVADNVDGNLYRFAPGGGQASAATLIGNVPGGPEGLAIAADGTLYAARSGARDVVQIDTATGRVVRTLASGIACATGLAVDPASGDLFVSQNQCGSTIFRISDLRGSAARVTPYTTLPNVDAIAFTRDGTLYATSFGTIYRISGTATGGAPTATKVAYVPAADGLAFGAQAPGAVMQFLVVNRIDGFVTRVDFGSQQQPADSDILSGGTRGDFVATDSHGCLYATQTDRVVRIVPANGPCNLASSTPGIRAEVPSQLALQCTKRKLVLIDVLQRGNRVDLRGAADRHLIGNRVEIFFAATGRALASAVVGADGFFHTTVPLPAASIRSTNRARYQARIGNDRSLDLKLTRRMDVRSITAGGETVTIRGRVVGPLAKPVAPIVVQRRVSCSQYVTATRVAPNRDGTFTATLPAPPHQQAAVYRAATFVRKDSTNVKLFRTFTLPRVVALG
jgi:hypothetical protein